MNRSHPVARAALRHLDGIHAALEKAL
jgi:hypothetical protein